MASKDRRSVKKLSPAAATEQLQREREFVSITLHELKAPLASARWAIETMKAGRAGPVSPGQLEMLDELSRGTQRLLTLVRDLLNLAKLQSGKFSVRLRSGRLGPLLRDVVRQFAPLAKEKNITLLYGTSFVKAPPVKLDSDRIVQVVSNLLSNAIKYTPSGGLVDLAVEISGPPDFSVPLPGVSAGKQRRFGKGRGAVVVSVRDTGIGIRPADQKKLFTRFFRSPQVMAGKIEGTGLGLYISQTIVELHGGAMWFKSRPGKGSTFFFSLPLAS